jgi:hypothetical protein
VFGIIENPKAVDEDEVDSDCVLVDEIEELLNVDVLDELIDEELIDDDSLLELEIDDEDCELLELLTCD